VCQATRAGIPLSSSARKDISKTSAQLIHEIKDAVLFNRSDHFVRYAASCRCRSLSVILNRSIAIVASLNPSVKSRIHDS
jgi:hypothetical protein